jgi:alanyl-tRNA synthetase
VDRSDCNVSLQLLFIVSHNPHNNATERSTMKTDEIREKYLSFYESKGHTRCASDVLVPTWDPSVLFTPAGMNPFKDHFLGKVKLEFKRATSSQKCLRTGDIENVGRTSYHHTFFEMLGNFSFGDYFKREAITWAWEFLTAQQWLGLDPGRLNVTVYQDDQEAANIWQTEIGLSTSRITFMGEDDNFWPAGAPSSGPDGVCGPCSEIFYLDEKGEEVEIWNLVFTQFNRVGDPPDNLRPLPSKNIDTGMGLERIAAVMQGVDTNYHIDSLRPIVEAAGEICSADYDPDSQTGRRLRRICDHVRACTFAIHENVYPGPNKEKYVIRRLLRRAVLDGHQLGLSDPFLYQLVPNVIEQMQAAYPELTETADRVQSVIQQEEATFLTTLDAGLERIHSVFAAMKDQGKVIVDGNVAAELYQTYGVPPELTESIGSEESFTFDWDGFREAMLQHGVESGKAQFELFKTGPIESLKRSLKETEFLGYDEDQTAATIKGLIVTSSDSEDQLADRVEPVQGQRLIVVTDRSTFYGESGGQVGDAGRIENEQGLFIVEDTQKDAALLLHYGYLESGCLTAGDKVTMVFDGEQRQAIRRAHSATHILHHALQTNLGTHAQQQGSKVEMDWLRFDFTNMEAVADDVLLKIELDVNELVKAQESIQWEVLPLADARSQGAMMLFGEKYPDPVRMVTMGEFSRELCGGTHLSNTGDVLQLEIISEEAVSAGTRRITALTGERCQKHHVEMTQLYQQLIGLLSPDGDKAGSDGLLECIEALALRVRALKKQLSGGGAAADQTDSPTEGATTTVELNYQQLRSALRHGARLLNVAVADLMARVEAMLQECDRLTQEIAQQATNEDLSADSLLQQGEEIGGAMVVVADIGGANPNLMRQLIDQIRKKTERSAIMLLGAQGDSKVVLVAGVSRELVAQGINAGDWVREVAPVVGGGGGGKPDMAQAGGKDPSQIGAAVEKASQVLQEMLADQ